MLIKRRLDNPAEAGGRLYEAIPAIVDSLDVVTEKLQAEFDVKPAEASAELDELFGGGITSSGAADVLPLAKEIQKPENGEKVRKLIVEVIESQKQIKKDSKTAGYLLKCCANAQADLAAAIKFGLRPRV